MVILALLFFLLADTGLSQTVVISEDVTRQHETPGFGINRRNFRHFYMGFHMVAGPADAKGADLVYRRSWQYELGYRYKRKFSEVLSAGFELNGKRHLFTPVQKEGKLVPDSLQHDREKLVLLSLGSGVYQRFNIGRRGDHMGRFFDLGVFGDLFVHARHVTFDTIEKEKIRIRRSGLSYPGDWGYGAFVRIGSGSFVIKGSYRASDLFKSAASLPEFPRFTAGIEFGIHP